MMKHILNEDENVGAQAPAQEFDYTHFADELLYNQDTPNGIDFRIHGAELDSLNGSPTTFAGEFNCSLTNLTSLVGGPAHIIKKNGQGGFYCDRLKDLQSLEGAPVTIDGDFSCVNPKMASSAGAPHVITGNCRLNAKAFRSLAKLDEIIPEIHGVLSIKNKILSNVLSVFKIKGLKDVDLAGAPPEVNSIVKEFLPMGKKGMMQCQTALIKAGFKDYAKT